MIVQNICQKRCPLVTHFVQNGLTSNRKIKFKVIKDNNLKKQKNSPQGL